MRINAFHALRPPADSAEQVSSPPYDVLTSREARELAEGNPASFLHVIKPEIDLPPETGPYADAVYAKAAENFSAFVDAGHLVRDEAPALFVYRQIMGETEQTGVVCTCHVDDYESDLIKKHEKTRPDKEDDRTRHVLTTGAHAGPVFLTYEGRPAIDALSDEAKRTDPLYDFTVGAVRHTVWRAPSTEFLKQAFEEVEALYVADGHHRSASAARAARERRDANPDHTGNEEYNWFLCVLFPAGELNVLAYNRSVRDLSGLSEEDFLQALETRFEVSEAADGHPGRAGCTHMYMNGTWRKLGWKNIPADDPVAALDVSILQDELLRPLLGIDDPRSSKRIEFVGGIHGPERLKQQVDSGDFAVAFSMYPTSVEQLMSVADVGKMMPPKSTWFEPKLRSGLLVHTLE